MIAHRCRICDGSIDAFMSFGRMPIANGFLSPREFGQEFFFELAPAFCEECGAFQLIEQPEPQRMFHENYAFFTRTSKRMVEHFANYAAWVRRLYLDDPDPFVIEIGSNDGAMLENFAKNGIRHLGVEPSANVAAVAERHGVRSWVGFFNAQAAAKIATENGQSDAIIAANVMCHIPDLHGIAEGVVALLKPRGVLVFEEPYLGDMLEKTSYDQIYDEHVFIFSLQSVRSAFEPHGLEIIEALPQATHGGSMRYVLARKGARPVTPSVAELARRERALSLGDPRTYDRFRRSCERNRQELRGQLEALRRDGKRVVGYGATSKSTTVLNYCDIGPELIEFISDTTPIKQGKFSPGAHIPVRPYADFVARYPDVALLLAWNHADEIMAKERSFAASGGRWLHFVPRVRLDRPLAVTIKINESGSHLEKCTISEIPERIWQGVYSDFSAAAADLDVFDSERWLASERRRLQAVEKSAVRSVAIPIVAMSHDYILPAVAATLAQPGHALRVLDFGGGLGRDYLALRACLTEDVVIDYHIVERPSLCEEGKRLFAEDTCIHFYDQIPRDLPDIDIFHAGSSLQYVENWNGLLNELAKLLPKRMIFAELHADEIERSYVTTQHYYGRRIPVWILNARDFIEAVQATGYKAVYRCNYQRPSQGYVLADAMQGLPEPLRLKNFCQMMFQRV